MKKLKLQIGRNLKKAVLVSGILGASLYMGCIAKSPGKMLANIIPFAGVAAGLKSKGKWEALDDGTKSFIELSDTQAEGVHKQLAELMTAKAALETAMKEAAEKGEGNEKTIKELEETAKKLAADFEVIKNRAASHDATSPIAKALLENADNIKAFKAKEKRNLTIEVKATQVATDIQTHTIGDYVPGIGQLPVRSTAIEPLFPVVNTTREYIRYMDQETVVRDAKNVAGCAATAHNTKLEWKQRNIQITKVRDFVDICLDMLDDYDFVEGELRNLVETSVNLKVDSQLLTGTGVDPELQSIDLAASEFSADNTLGDTIEAWSGKVQDPKLPDLIIAMASQIVALGQQNAWTPNVVLVNTIDQFKNMVEKDKNNNYINIPFMTKDNHQMATIHTMRVVANPLIPANTCYVFDSTKGTLYNRKGITVDMSYDNNDNFEREVVTLKAYRRMNLLIRNVNKNAFMKCSDVEAALTAISKP